MRRALKLLASNPGGTTEDMLVVDHGLSADMLATLVLAGLAKGVTATLRAEGGTFTIERLHITLRRPVGGRSKVDRALTVLPSTGRNAAAAPGVGFWDEFPGQAPEEAPALAL